jgi:multidrug resistance efflux pump
MTLIAIHDLWIDADMTENNLGNIKPGDEAAIVLDVLPGEILKGRVRSVGYGVSSGQEAPPGALPTIQNSRDWLRQAQRFPVAIEFDASDAERLRKVRVGGQAEVMVFTGNRGRTVGTGHFFLAPARLGRILYGCAAATVPFRTEPSRA